jgi:hypothetical protein
LHGQSDLNEEAEARITTQMVHKTVHEAITNHKQVLANMIGNVMKEVFFRAPIDISNTITNKVGQTLP